MHSLVKLGRWRYAGAQIVRTYRLLVYFWGGTQLRRLAQRD
jgi:hypothetical protein